MIADKLLKNLKIILFDLSLSIGEVNRHELMQELVCTIHDLFAVKNISIHMRNQWNINSQLDVHQSQAGYHYGEQLARNVVDHYDLYADVQYVVDEQDRYHLVKLKCNDHYYGVIVLTYHGNEKIDHNLLNRFGELLSIFLKSEYQHREEAHRRRRQQYFVELTTNLHAVHESTKILKHMYMTVQKLYPFFEFSLLMSQEYDIEEIPMELIEYSGEMAQLPGTMAFIDNEIKVEMEYDEDKMFVYSPLAGKQGVYGVLKIMAPQIISHDEIEWDLIKQISNITGMAIERTTLFQSSNKQVSNLQAINHASKALNSSLERTDIIQTVKKYLLEMSEADDCAIILYEEGVNNNKAYELSEESAHYFSSENGRQLISYINHELHIKDEAILTGNFPARYLNSPYHSLMAIPMRSTENVFGLIIVVHQKPYYFTFDLFRFVQSFIQHASLALKNSMLKEQLHQLATTDYLTKLRSRKYLDNKVTAHMEEGNGGTLILFDIDDFKQINDTFGHYIGDQVLQDIADIIKKELQRTTGVAARWGGEEFALYLPYLGNDDVLETADNIRNMVFDMTDPQVTLSCGTATWKKDSVLSSIKSLFIHADEALYEAKTSGKNRTIQKMLY